MKEIWKDIKGYKGLYQISNLGNVKSLKRNIKLSNQYGAKFKKRVDEKILKQSINKYGYCSVILSKNNKNKWFSIHRLVALNFIPNPNNYKCVNHKDENKQNNNVENLEWCTYKYNNNYGNRINKVREKTKKKINQYDINNILIKSWNSIIEASNNLKINRHSIISCCKGKQKTAGGFKWQYRKVS